MKHSRQLFFERPGRLSWRSIEAPSIEGPAQALVRPIAAARCDLDAAILTGRAPFRSAALHWLRDHLPEPVGKKGIFKGAPFAGPFAFGHECVAEVIAVGEGVRRFAAGDRVVVPFQISCGACERCERGVTSSCSSVAHTASYGLGRGQWGGVIGDVVRVPYADAMLLRAPEGVAAIELASAGDNVADGFRTVAQPLRERPGAPVLVVGGEATSVGLYAVLAAVALGSSDVAYIDPDSTRRASAAALGARIIGTRYQKSDRGFAITVDASAHHEGLAAAVLSTEPGGTCTSVGIYFEARTPFPLLGAFINGITFHTGRVASRAVLPSVLDAIAAGTLRPSRVPTRVASWESADEAFFDGTAKVVIEREPLGRGAKSVTDAR
ncbi:MAG: alcohol dehydrogenase catalytic domain-containing protein [Myxococcales bacterium]|nr:alcohol dehydrogenase catalytic domain-containing protein [Myxococcales bacterium]